MYQSNGQQPKHPQSIPYQQLQSHQTPRAFQQQQFGPRFQTPPQQFTPPRPFYQPSRPYHSPVQPHHQGPVQPPQFFHSPNTNFDPTPKPPYQPPPLQNFETPPTPPYQLPIQNLKTPPNPHFPPPPVGPDFNQMSIPSYRTPGPTYEPTVQNYNQPPVVNYNQPPPVQNYNQPPPVQNYNQPPPVQNYNQPPPVQNYNQPPPIKNFNNHPPIQNYNHPPPIQNCNQPISSCQPTNQNFHPPMSSPSPGYSSTLNSPYQPQIQSPESIKKPYQLPANPCYGQQQPPFNLHRPEFNQRPLFRPSGQQRFPFNNQKPRYQQPQHDNNRFQFNPRQSYHNHRPRGPHTNLSTNFMNQPKGNNVPKKDKLQIACDLGDCDFVGHASAVKEHQNMHHRLGLHKKVLYSNNSDAIKSWIEERKKKWPTKETIKIKSEIEEEKNKRGERIVDEDFQRFNKNNNKFKQSGSKRFNNRKRPRCNGEFVEPVEEPMNGKLKRFCGITAFIKEEESLDETKKPVALKLLEEYDESNDSQSDDEPPEETVIVKKSTLPDNINLVEPNEELCSTSEIRVVSIENNKVDKNSSIIEGGSESVSTEVNIDKCISKENEASESTNTERGTKRKKTPKKESKPIKKPQPLRTPRTEIVERKGALLEALMGDLMRSERNTITQCICYIRNNMHRFTKIQAA